MEALIWGIFSGYQVNEVQYSLFHVFNLLEKNINSLVTKLFTMFAQEWGHLVVVRWVYQLF